MNNQSTDDKTISFALRVDNLSKIYYNHNDKAVPALKDINFQMGVGEIVAIVGPSGSGKSTLLHILAGLVESSEGQVAFGNELYDNGKPRIGLGFQEHVLLPWRTVKENAILGVETRNPNESRSSALLDKLNSYFEEFGLIEFQDAYPDTLSVGMRSRVSLIQVLLTKPKLLLLDEPFAALDYDVKLFLEKELLQTAKREQITIVFVTHDLEEAIAISHRVMVFAERPGTIKWIENISFSELVRDPVEARKHPKFHNHFATLVEQVKYLK